MTLPWESHDSVLISGARSAWIPPPYEWHQLWREGTLHDLPYGLLNPTTDYIWRWMRQHTHRYVTIAEIAEHRSALTLPIVRASVRSMWRNGCAIKAPVKAGEDRVAYAFKDRRQSHWGMIDGKTEWRVKGSAIQEWSAIRPETPVARHLRWLHTQPTPPAPAGLSKTRQQIWDCLADHAIGAASHISAAALAELLDIDRSTLRSHMSHIRRIHPGVCQRLLGCQTSVYRLRSGNKYRKVSDIYG